MPGCNAKEKMVVVVVGTGKLAQELLSELPNACSFEVIAWAEVVGRKAAAKVVVHAGSGRQLDEVIAYCQETGATLVELATGSALEGRELSFPVVICPNTNILMLKFMAMLAANGHHFENYALKLVESHQAGKTSVAGTAVALAQSLGLASEAIVSIRDPHVQSEMLGIPVEHLSRHAYHRIEIQDHVGSIVLETKVFGQAPYADGVAQILAAVCANPLEHRRYNVMELIALGWV